MSIPFIQLGISPVTQEELQSSDVTSNAAGTGSRMYLRRRGFISVNDFVSGHRPIGVCSG